MLQSFLLKLSIILVSVLGFNLFLVRITQAQAQEQRFYAEKTNSVEDFQEDTPKSFFFLDDQNLLDHSYSISDMENQYFLNDLFSINNKITSNSREDILSQQNKTFTLEIYLQNNQNDHPLKLPSQPKDVYISNTLPLTLDQAITLAKVSNRNLQIAKIQLEQAQAVLEQAQSALLPKISANVRGNYSVSSTTVLGNRRGRKDNKKQAKSIKEQNRRLRKAFDKIENSLKMPFNPNDPIQVEERINLLIRQSELKSNFSPIPPSNRYKTKPNRGFTASLEVNYSLYSPTRKPNIDDAKEKLTISELGIKIIEANLIKDVSLAYFNLQQANQQNEINLNDVQSRNERLEGISMLVDAGLATRLDLLNAQIELDNSIQVLENSQITQETAQRNLAKLLNLSPSISPIINERVKIAGYWQLSLEQTIILALNNRVELEQKLAERESAKAQRKIALAGVRPTVSLYSRIDLLQDIPSGNNAWNFDSNFAVGYSVGFQANWTFFDGNSSNAQVRQAEALIAITEQGYGEEANKIRFEVESAYFQLYRLLNNIQTATQSIKRAEEAVKAAQIRFRATVNTQTEVLDAQKRLVQAQNNRLNAIINYNKAFIQLERAIK